MLGPSVDKLFERYRRRGDAAALAKVFDATAPELFRLAQHLVRDPLEAEDVLQETFVTAIDAAERWDASRPLVPWLTGILARKASEARRRARRALEPERLVEREEADPADLAADSELSRGILEAIDALPELYRAVLRRHLLDGSKPAEIARDLGRAPGTVRMQLHRGLEQLRKTLPAGFAAGAALYGLAPRGLAAVREAVMTHAASVGATAGVAAPIAAKASTFALGKLAGVSALGIALALFGVVAWKLGFAEQPPRGAAPTPLAPSAAPASTDLHTAVGDAGSRAESPSAPVPWRRSRIYLVGRVLGPAPEEMASVRLEVRGVARYEWPASVVASGAPASDGSFELLLDRLIAHAAKAGRLDELVLSADHPAYVPAEVRVHPSVAQIEEPGSARMRALLRSDIDLRRAAILRGSVRRVESSPAPIFVSALPVSAGTPQQRVLDSARVSSVGTYTLRVGESGDIEVVAAAADALPASSRSFASVGQESIVAELHLQVGTRLEGTWRNGAARAPFDQVHVAPSAAPSAAVQIALGGRQLGWSEGSWRSLDADVPLQEDGTFVVAGLESGTWELRPAKTWSQPLLLPELASAQVVELRSQIEHAALDLGCGYAGVRVLDASDTPRPCEVAVSFASNSEPASVQRLPTNARGELVLAVPSDSKVSFEVEGAVIAVPSPAAGMQSIVDLRIVSARPAASAALALAGLPEAQLDGEVSVSLQPIEGAAKAPQWRKAVLANGVLNLTDLPGVPLRAELFLDGAYRHYQGFWQPLRVELDLASREHATASLALEQGGRLRIAARDRAGVLLGASCRVRDLYGAEIPVRFLLRSPDEQGFTPGERLSERGPSDVYPNLAPGVVELELAMEGRETRVQVVQVRAGEVTSVEVVLP